ncbi:MAG TPA: hypothetical protein EYQ18_11990 [Candidatus Handelsmanbacteria bacterium]|jgi:hypothetical protein|nr:hypothetical protein [Candidatus Handelsmanbacteria bacterium]
MADENLVRYEADGAVTIDTPFTTAEMDLAEAAWHRLKADGSAPYEDPDIFDQVCQVIITITHPSAAEAKPVADVFCGGQV